LDAASFVSRVKQRHVRSGLDAAPRSSNPFPRRPRARPAFGERPTRASPLSRQLHETEHTDQPSPFPLPSLEGEHPPKTPFDAQGGNAPRAFFLLGEEERIKEEPTVYRRETTPICNPESSTVFRPSGCALSASDNSDYVHFPAHFSCHFSLVNPFPSI